MIVAVPADNYEDWAAKNHEPEEDFLKAMKGIEGVTTVETQTYTLMPM